MNSRKIPFAVVAASVIAVGSAQAYTLEDALSDADFIGFRDVIEIEGPGMFECVTYDAATDTCESILSYVLLGDAVIVTEAVRFANITNVTFSFVDRMRIEDGLICSDFRDMSIEVFPDQGYEVNSAVIDPLVRQMMNVSALFGELCAAYLRNGDSYDVGFFTEDGVLLDGLFSESRFMAREPTLRPME